MVSLIAHLPQSGVPPDRFVKNRTAFKARHLSTHTHQWASGRLCRKPPFRLSASTVLYSPISTPARITTAFEHCFFYSLSAAATEAYPELPPFLVLGPNSVTLVALCPGLFTTLRPNEGTHNFGKKYRH